MGRGGRRPDRWGVPTEVVLPLELARCWDGWDGRDEAGRNGWWGSGESAAAGHVAGAAERRRRPSLSSRMTRTDVVPTTSPGTPPNASGVLVVPLRAAQQPASPSPPVRAPKRPGAGRMGLRRAHVRDESPAAPQASPQDNYPGLRADGVARPGACRRPRHPRPTRPNSADVLVTKPHRSGRAGARVRGGRHPDYEFRIRKCRQPLVLTPAFGGRELERRAP